MAKNLMQTDQMSNDAALSEIAPSASTSLDTIFSQINSIVQEPAALTVTGSSLVLTVGHTVVTAGPSGRKKGLPQLKSVDLGDLTGTVDFATGTGDGTFVQSFTLPSYVANEYRRFGIELRSDKKAYIVYGATTGSTPALAAAPAFTKNGLARGEIVLRYVPSPAGNGDFVTPTNANITQFGSGSGGSGSGSGVGGINYVDNFEGDIDTTGWTRYKNTTPATIPEVVPGGTPDAGFTFTVEATSPLRAGGSFLITKPLGVYLGNGIYYNLLTFDNFDKGRLIEFSFDYLTTDPAYDVAIYICDRTNGTIITPLGDNFLYTGKNTFKGAFLTVSSSASYRILFHIRAATSTPAWTCYIDNVVVGPETMKESLKKNVHSTGHGFSVGDIVYSGANFWYKARADNATANSFRNLHYVTEVLDANNFTALSRGVFRPSSSLATGQWYLSDTTAGTATQTDNAMYSIPIYYINNNTGGSEGYFDPQRPHNLDEMGDLSFRPRKVTSPNVYLRGGAITLSSGDVLVSGSGTTEATVKVPLTLDLGTIATNSGVTPSGTNTYYLYIDRVALSSAINLSDSGRKVINVATESHFKMFLTTPDGVNASRYVEVGYVKYNTASWSTVCGWTPSRSHNLLANYFNPPQIYKNTAINTNTVTNLSHALSGEPQLVSLYFYDSSASERQPLDTSSYIRKVSNSTITVDSNGFTFDSGDYLEVEATYFPSSGSLIATPSSQFETGWYADTLTTSVAHGRSDMEDIKGLVVQEWDITAGRRRNIPVESLVEDFDSTYLYFNWSGLSPSSTLKYRVTTAGSALPQALPDYIGGFNKFVGYGPGSYTTLTAASPTTGDSILVNRSYSISAAETISGSDLRIVFMPGVAITQTAAAKGLIISGSNVCVDCASYIFTVSGTVPAGIEISGDDCFVEKTSIVANNAGLTITAGINMTATSERNFVNVNLKKTAGAITANFVDAGTNNECLNRG